MSVVNAIMVYNPLTYKDNKLSVTDEDTANNFGKIKLIRLDPRVQWHSTSSGTVRVVIDYGTPGPKVKACHIGNHNFGGASPGEVKFQAGSTSSTTDRTLNVPVPSENTINSSFRIQDITVDEYWQYQYFALDISISKAAEVGVFLPFGEWFEIPLSLEDFKFDPRGYRNQNFFTGFSSSGVFSVPRFIPFQSANVDNAPVPDPPGPDLPSLVEHIEGAALSDYILFWPDGFPGRQYFGPVKFERFGWLTQEEGAGVTNWQGSGVFQNIDVTAAEKQKWERLSS